MADGKNPFRRPGSGLGDGSIRTQFGKGKSGNPKGRPRGSPKPKIDLIGVVMEKVTITRNGKKKKVPFPIAHVERLKERVVKGDPKADQAMFHLYKILDVFEPLPATSEEPYEFTLRIGRQRNPLLDDEADGSSSSTKNTDKSDDKDDDD